MKSKFVVRGKSKLFKSAGETEYRVCQAEVPLPRHWYLTDRCMMLIITYSIILKYLEGCTYMHN